MLMKQKDDKQKSKTKNKKWFQLDLSANVYPTLQRKNFSSVYRLSVLLNNLVDPILLQQAVDITLPRFPTFQVAIHKGVFWRYLETNHRPGPFVQEDVQNCCMPLHFKSNNHYLIRVYYYERRISFESHHSLADGSGGMFVLQTITANYLRLLGHSIPNEGFVLDVNEAPKPAEFEDSYVKYANSRIHNARTQGKAYRVRGTQEPFYTLNIIGGIMSTNEVYKKAKWYGASITEYLNAVLIYALLKKQKSEHHFHELPVKIAMPVNLRRFFPSKTLRNFITMIYPSIDPRLGDYKFEEILTQIHFYMRYYLNDKFLNADISTNVATQKNPFIRITPLFIKDFVVKLFYTKVQDHQSSAGLTNMGALSVPHGMEQYIERFDIYMGQPFSARTNCAICSFGDVLTVNFASSIVEADVEEYFFSKLIEDGIHVKIETNRKLC